MYGLGKPETRVKKLLKRFGKNQEWLCTAAPVDRNTATKLCSEEAYYPSPIVAKKVLIALRKLDPTVKYGDFWNM